MVPSVAEVGAACSGSGRAETIWFGFDIGELSCPARYFEGASSINFRRSVKYGFGVLGTALKFRLARMHLSS